MHDPCPGELTPAERVRTMLAISGDLGLQGPAAGHDRIPVPRHVVLPDGSLLLAAVPGVGVGDLVTMVGHDVASVPQPARVRGALRMRGVMAPWTGPRSAGVLAHLAGPVADGEESSQVEVACLRPVSVELDWRCEGTPEGWQVVGLDDYRAAGPDPLVADEHRWLPHLQRDHGDAVRRLALRALPALDAATVVRPLVLDRAGLVLRVYSAGGHHDTRLAFPAPASCACAVRDAFGELLGHGATQGHRHH